MKLATLEIDLDALHFYAHHGVMEQEQQVGAHFTVNLSLRLSPSAKGVETDELAGTVHYGEVYELVRREMHTPSRLLEHVAGRILKALFEEHPLVQAATIEIGKDTPPIVGFEGKGCRVRLAATR